MAVVTSVSNSMPADYALFVHANYLEPGICRGRNVVYCPRTHAAFGHHPYPLKEFLDGGARIALGTDSLASNPDLSVLAEARHVRERHAQVPGDTLLRMITLNGAQMLGWDAVAGSLEPGKSADLAVVPIADLAFDDPHDVLFRSGEPVARVMFRGQWLS